MEKFSFFEIVIGSIWTSLAAFSIYPSGNKSKRMRLESKDAEFILAIIICEASSI